MEAKKVLSQTVRPLVDLATNQKYNGRQVYNPKDSAGQRIKEQVGYVAGQYNHPYVQTATNIATGNSSGALENVSTALELPLRFRDPFTPKSTTPTAAGDWKAAFNSREGQAFLNHTEAEKKQLAQTDPQAAQFLKLQEAAKRSVATPDLPHGISPQAADTLTRYARLTPQAQSDWLKTRRTPSSSWRWPATRRSSPPAPSVTSSR